jgi:hypothetical protein
MAPDPASLPLAACMGMVQGQVRGASALAPPKARTVGRSRRGPGPLWEPRQGAAVPLVITGS